MSAEGSSFVDEGEFHLIDARDEFVVDLSSVRSGGENGLESVRGKSSVGEEETKASSLLQGDIHQVGE